MGGADHARFQVGEQHRRAIGGEDAEREAGRRGDDGVGMRPRLVGPGLGGDQGGGRMDLVQGHQPPAWRDRRHGAAAIFGDGGAVVVRAQADIETGTQALRHAAAAAEEAVRYADQAGADRFDTHALNLSRMIRSSSAWSPTMKS